MGWRDAPLTEQQAQPAWKSAPLVGAAPTVPAEPGSSADNPVEGAVFAPPIATDTGEIPWYAQKPPTPQPDGPGFLERQLESAANPRDWQIAAQGTGRGLANIAGAPMDLAAGAHNGLMWLGEKIANMLPGDQNTALPRVDNPPGGSQSIADFFAKHLMEPAGITPIEQQDMTPREQLGYNIDNFGTQALTGGAGLATKAASQAERAVTEGGRLAPSVLDSLTKAYLDNPGKALATDVAAGAGSGTAVTGAHHYLPDWTQGPVTDMLATLIGGAGGASMANMSRIPGAVKSTARSMSVAPEVKVAPGEHPFTNKQVDLASQYVQGKMANPQQGAQDYRASVRDALTNSDPVPAADMASKDIGLLDLGKIARQRDPVPFEKNSQAIRDRALERTLTLRDENANPRAPQEYANKVAGQQRQQAQQGVGAAQQQLEAAQQQLETNKNQAQDIAAPVLATRGTTGDASQALDKTVVDETMKPRQTQKNDLINQVDKSGTAVVDPARIQDTLKSIKDRAGKLTGGRELPTEFTDKLSALTDEQKPVTVRDLTEMRPYLTKASEQARNAGEYGLKDNIDALRRQSNAEIDRLAESGDIPAAEAQRYYKEEFAPFFAEGKGGELRKAINKDSIDRANTPPSKTAERFLIAGGAGSEEAARDLRKIIDIAPNPAAGDKAVRDYMVARLANNVNADGTIRPATLSKWMDNNQAILDQFPDLKNEVTGLRRAIVNNQTKGNALSEDVKAFSQNLREAEGSAAETERRIQQSHLGVLINSDPQTAVARVLGASDRPKAMKALVQDVANDPAAAAGWKRAVTDYLVEHVTTTNRAMRADNLSGGLEGQVSMASLSRLFTKNADALAEVYTPAEMNNLRRVHKILEPLGNLGRKATGGSDTVENQLRAQNEPARNALEAFIKLKFGGLRGGNIMRNIGLLTKNLPHNSVQADKLLSRMWFDPQVASLLMERDIKQVGTPAWNSKLTKLLGYGAAARADVQGAPDNDGKDVETQSDQNKD